MLNKSAKAKGRNLQNLVRDLILSLFPTLTHEDVRSCRMGDRGEDVQLSAAARALFPFSIECKRRKAFSVYQHYDQATRPGHGEPVVVIQADRRSPLAIVDLDTFMALAVTALNAAKTDDIRG